jgi:hypothetical protein
VSLFVLLDESVGLCFMLPVKDDGGDGCHR